jgi:hypothetical protein
VEAAMRAGRQQEASQRHEIMHGWVAAAPPIIILTSSADRTQFGTKVNSYRFSAKADITATVIASLANTREQAG